MPTIRKHTNADPHPHPVTFPVPPSFPTAGHIAAVDRPDSGWRRRGRIGRGDGRDGGRGSGGGGRGTGCGGRRQSSFRRWQPWRVAASSKAEAVVCGMTAAPPIAAAATVVTPGAAIADLRAGGGTPGSASRGRDGPRRR